MGWKFNKYIEMNKINIIQDVQNLASKLFNKEVAKMHYSKDRLNGFTMNQLLDLERWFKKRDTN
jgi:hypothetical protein